MAEALFSFDCRFLNFGLSVSLLLELHSFGTKRPAGVLKTRQALAAALNKTQKSKDWTSRLERRWKQNNTHPPIDGCHFFLPGPTV